MLRATCSADFHRCRRDSNDTKDTRVSAGSRRTTYRDQENVCSRQNCQPRVTFDAPKPDARTAFNKDGEKHSQRKILESRDIRQVTNKRRVEVQSQNRDLLIRDVCTCLARWVAASVPRTGQCRQEWTQKKTAREGTPGPMSEKRMANCRQKSISTAGRQRGNPHGEWRRQRL